MKYARLKTINGTGTIMRYFTLAEEETAESNVFYEVLNGKAQKIADGVTPTGNIIGFSHGGDKLIKGEIFLDVNPAVVYVAKVETAENLPAVNDVIDGYKKVIDVHENDFTYEFVIGGEGATAMPNPSHSERVEEEGEGEEGGGTE